MTPYIAARVGWSWGLYVGSLVAILGVVALYFVKLQGSSAADRFADCTRELRVSDISPVVGERKVGGATVAALFVRTWGLQ